MKTKLIHILSLLLLAGLVSAQISGNIIDAETKQGLSGVEVIELSSGETTLTNSKGSFTLSAKETASLELVLYKDGFQILELSIDSVKAPYIFEMKALQVELSEIEVIRKKKEIFATKKLADIVGTSIYAGKKTEVVVMDQIKGNTAANVSRQVYAQISGLNIYEGSDGGLQLNIGGRGLDPNRTSNFNTRQNGYDISADVLGYPENYYTPPSEALEEIRIVRGASSLQYGTQFGGLIDFRIREIPRYKKWDFRTKQTVGSFNFFNSFNALGYNSKRFAIDAFYNYKSGDGYRSNSEFAANNAFLSTRLHLSNKTRLSLEWTYYGYLAKQAGGLTDLQFQETPRLSTRDRNWFKVDWQLYNLKFLHNFSKQKKLEFNLFGLSASRKSVGYRGNPIVLNENPILSLDEVDTAGNYLSSRDLIIGNFKNIGAEIRYLDNYKLKNINATFLVGGKYYNSANSSIQGPGTKGSDADFSLQTALDPDYPNQSDFDFPNLNFALFTENICYLTDKLSVTPGLRLEYIKTQSTGSYQEVVYDLAGNPLANNTFQESNNFPRQFLLAGIGMEYNASEARKYSINLSQNYRSVTFSDIRVVNPSFIVDENITDENGFSFNTSMTGRINSKFSYDLTLYSILYNNRIGIILDDRANRVRTNIGDAIIAGTESLINYIPVSIVRESERIFQVKTFLNTSFTYSKYLSSLSNNVVGNQVEHIPTANIKTGLSMTYKKLNCSLQYSYVSEQYTDAQNSRALLTNELRSGVIGEIPSYQVIDFSTQYRFKSFSLEAGINNLLDHNYFTRRATGYPGPGIIPSEGRSLYLTVGYNFEK